MDGPKDYCANWNKPNRERQISNEIIYIWIIKKKEFIYKTQAYPQT